ncbi:pimeloyl-ACP methyl ester carboxylesterase [Bradyrhizobium sp. AZCC 1577]
MWGTVMDFVTVTNGAIKLNVAVSGSGPLIVCVHGFPELGYSWRHQIAHRHSTLPSWPN